MRRSLPSTMTTLVVVVSGLVAASASAPSAGAVPTVRVASAPSPVVARVGTPTVPFTWVSSWSTRTTGAARVGRVVAVDATTLTRRARARGARVSYRWYVGKRRTAATGLSFRVPSSAHGRRVRVRVAVERAGMTARTLLIGFGTAAGVPQDPEVVQEARAQVLAAINARRVRNGLAELREMDELTALAQRWSERMTSTQQLTHNLSLSGQLPAGWRAAAENVAMGAEPVDVVGWWMTSTGHRDNLLGAYNRVGIGVAVDARGRYWYTADLARY